MNEAAAFIGIIPQLLLLAIIVVGAILLRRPITEHVVPRVSRVSVAGVSVDLEPGAIRRAFETQEAHVERPLPTDDSIDAVRLRAERNAPVIQGRTAVWIDEHPEWTQVERLALHRMGLFVEPVTSVDAARDLVANGIGGKAVSLLISDIAADDGRKHDAEVLGIAKAALKPIPVIFYIANLRPGTPEGAFGITNRPDVLWHLVMDAMERVET